jgi:histidinol-phosphate aminotransferase
MMEKALDIIKPQVRALRPYSLRTERAKIKLNQNENPWDAPTEIKEKTFKQLANRAWSRYPDFVPLRLRERLAKFTGWKPEGIRVGNGSNELIQAVLMVTVGEGKRVLISEPTFALYRQIATVLGGQVVSVPLTPDLTYHVEMLRDKIRSAAPDVTIVCSPNNPTGCVIDHVNLALLLKSTRGLVLVDEAYFEFSGQSVIPLLAQYPNLVVLRTFSKAMAMAALRVGYLLASPELVQEISKAVLPYNLNVISQTAAEVALEMYEMKLEPLVRRIITEREYIYVQLKDIPGLTPIPSWANFMLVRSAMESNRVFTELLKRDILVRDVSTYPMLQDYFRISVGTAEENDQLLRALREIFS